jgi:hypothetical protein
MFPGAPARIGVPGMLPRPVSPRGGVLLLSLVNASVFAIGLVGITLPPFAFLIFPPTFILVLIMAGFASPMVSFLLWQGNVPKEALVKEEQHEKEQWEKKRDTHPPR